MVPLKGTFLLTATSELRGGKYLQVWGHIIHWYYLALETHQLPAVEISPLFAFGACKSAATPRRFRREKFTVLIVSREATGRTNEALSTIAATAHIICFHPELISFPLSFNPNSASLTAAG